MFLPILMYHDVEATGATLASMNPGRRRYAVLAKNLDEHLRVLRDAGFASRTLEEIPSLLPASRLAPMNRPIVLTFDDGRESNYNVALGILQTHGFKAHFFVTPGKLGRKGYLSAEQVRDLLTAGMGIGSHGLTHRVLTDLPEKEWSRELRESKLCLEDITGATITSFAPPGGRISPAIIRKSFEIGYKQICTSDFGLNNLRKEGSVYRRIPVKQGDDGRRLLRLVQSGPNWFEAGYYHMKNVALTIFGSRMYNVLRNSIRASFPDRSGK